MVSRWEIVALAVNSVVGSGIYLLPAAAAALLGPASLWAVPLAGAAVALLVLCFAEAATHFDEPGGAYLYTREAFGPLFGFEVGWMTWLARVATIAALSNGVVQALGFLWPGVSGGMERALVIGGPLALFTGINLVGIKGGARLVSVFVIAKLVPLLFLIGVGLLALDPGLLPVLEAPPPEALGEAALLLLFAYAGFEATAAPAGEYRNPRRDVPFALVTMIVGVTGLYFLIQLVALGTLPDLAARTEGAPLAEAAARLAGSRAGVLMTAGAVVSMLGIVASVTLAGPRYLFALARDGFGPRALAAVHPRWRTPHVAILAQGVAAFALALSGTFVQLAMLSIVARLATYIGTAAAVPVLRRKMPAEQGAFRLPGGPVIPVAAVLLCLVFLSSTTRWNLMAGAVALVVGLAVWATRRRPVEESAVPPA
ncbi:MAG TPA: APC family permease [Gemmatimonadota bacterium]|nr:APC family permease [Gemmatimonadota bacterium]